MTSEKRQPEPADSSNVPAGAAGAGVTLRSLLIALALIPINTYWVIQVECVVFSTAPTVSSLFLNVIFILFVLLLVNQFLLRFLPRWALTPPELAVIYVMLSVSTVMSSTETVQALVGTVGYPTWFSDESTSYIRMMPSFLLMTDVAALRDFYVGQSSLWHHGNLRAWLGPLGWWLALWLLLLSVMVCIGAALQRRWIRSERLTFPLAQLPIAMARDGNSLLRARATWIGFTFAGLVGLINGLSRLYPGIPGVLSGAPEISSLVPGRISQAISPAFLMIHLFVIGLGMLMPLDLLFSTWVFWVLKKVQMVAIELLGWTVGSAYDFPLNQSAGAFAGIGLVALWSAREELASVLSRAFRRRPPSQPGSALSDRMIALGVFGGFAGLVAFGVASGMSITLSLCFFLIYVVFAVAVSRMRAELGPVTLDLYRGPCMLIPQLMGTKIIPARELTALMSHYWYNRYYGTHPMPHEVEAFKLADASGTRKRSISAVVILAAAAGSIACCLAVLATAYRLGGQSAMYLSYHGDEAYRFLSAWLADPTDPDGMTRMGVSSGLVITVILMVLKLRYFWWPLHPIGYAVSGVFLLDAFWLSLVVAWLAKIAILRYGGLRLYRRSLGFFFGLIMGDAVIGAFWATFGAMSRVRVYDVWLWH